jgi:ABC-type lipoprotein export system ATPase subunit
MSSLLSLVGVCRVARRGGRVEPLLVDVSLEVEAGELVGIVGTRSQGKTTLLQIAAGLERPDGGLVCFRGRDLAGVRDRELARLLREEIGLAGQSGPRVDLRVVHYVAAPLLVDRRRGRRRAAFARAESALERVGMESRCEQRWDDLSRWDRALVEIAQGIVTAPRLLLVDDVSDGLGMWETVRVTGLLRSFAREDEVGILMAVSDGEAALAADRVFSLAEGRLEALAGRNKPPENVVKLPFAKGAGAG